MTGATSDIDRSRMRSKSYLQLVGSLLWVTISRPDVSFYVSFLCQFMQDPSPQNYDAALGIVSYLQQTKNLGLTYVGTKAMIEVYADSSWGSLPKPFAGYVIKYGGASISYQSKKLKLVAQSSAEAETAVYALSAKNLQFVLHLFEFLDNRQQLPIHIFTDNAATRDSIKNPGVTARTRHYARWLLYAREQFLHRISAPHWISTSMMTADIFTKCLDKTTFLRHRSSLLNDIS
eukprot:scaffold189228_cov48-Tisochrysis_lutea.AAC.1